MSEILCIYMLHLICIICIKFRGGGPAQVRGPGQNGPERFTLKGASCSSKGA